MKLKKYIKLLQKMDLESEVVYSCDDEGNYYDKVLHAPAEGKFDEATYDFVDTETIENAAGFKHAKNYKTNAVCIN